MTTRAPAHRSDRQHLQMLLRTVTREADRLARLSAYLGELDLKQVAVQRTVEAIWWRLRRAARLAERYTLTPPRSSKGRPPAATGRAGKGTV